MPENEIEKVKRSIFIRIFSSIFWLVITILLICALVGAVIGGMSGATLDTAGMSPSEAYDAGAQAGGDNASAFMLKHGGKVMLSGLGLWIILSITGLYPGVSKYKK